jgi:hypothetical protein
MPSRDFPEPENFPDMTIPERTDKAPAPIGPVFPSAQVSWKIGDRVLAPWEPDFLYVGRVAQLKGKEALIEFEDGDAGWVMLDQIRPLVVKQGQKVLSRRKMGPHFFPGEILEVRGDQVRIGFQDGQGDEWTKIAALRIPCQARGQGAAPTKVASHTAFLEKLQPGDRVWAPWNNSTLFAGTVDQMRGKEVHVHFDDGDSGWVLLEQIVPLQIVPGLRVLGRWKMGAHYFPGTVTKVEGQRVHIKYDDGDQEWTKPAALMLPCQPLGPDARPSKVARRSSLLGWLIPIAIGIIVLIALWGASRR